MRRASLLMVAATAAALLLSGCECGKTRTGADTDSVQTDSVEDRLAFDSVAYIDSFRTASNTLITQALHATWPVPDAESVLADSIRHWLTDLVSNSAMPAWGEEGIVLPQVGGGIRDGRAVLAHYGEQGLEQMKRDVRASEADSFIVSAMANELDVSFLCDTLDYVTLSSGHYVYTGGAHGGYIIDAATFRKSDGHRMGWDFIQLDKRAQLIALLREGLRQYFEVDTDEALDEQLMLFDDPDTPADESATLPLPATEPYLSGNGLNFVYQQYEIAAYAAGLPSVTIPIDKIRPLLKVKL